MSNYYNENFKCNGKTYNVKLYDYTRLCIVLTSEEEFTKGFSKKLKEIGGRFNKNLTIDEEKTPGWCFKKDSDTQKKIVEFLKNVSSGKEKLETSELVIPQIGEIEQGMYALSLIDDLIEYLPEETSEVLLSSENNIETRVYYNPKEEDIIIGNIIKELSSAHKKAVFTQLEL